MTDASPRSTRRLPALAALGALISFIPGGCTSTVIGFAGVEPGRQLIVNLQRAGSPARITNSGPGVLQVVVVDAAHTVEETTPAGTMTRMTLRAPCTLIVRNAAAPDAQPTGFKIVIPDPCTFDANVVPVPPASP